MAQTKPITKSGYLVTIKGIDAYWSSSTEINDATQTTEYSDGLSNRNYKLMGMRKLDDVTLSKAFDPVADKAIVDWWRNYCDGKDTPQTISITPVKYCPDPEAIGPVATLYNVRPVALKGFAVDKKSNDVAMLELTICADDFTYQ